MSITKVTKKIVANKFYCWCDLKLIKKKKKEKSERVTGREQSEGRKGKRRNALEE